MFSLTMRPAAYSASLLFLSSLLSLNAQEAKPVITLKISADFLALHVNGKAPAGTTALEYRLAETSDIADKAEWRPLNQKLADDGSFAFDLPLETSRWSELQIRALKQAEVLARKETHRDVDTFKMLTPERLAALPASRSQEWTAYVKRSNDRAAKEYDILAAECRKLGLPKAKPAPGSRAEFELDSDTPASWFASDEAKALADAAISYQTPTGGWSKAVNYKAGPRASGTHWTNSTGDAWHYCGTFDNRSTTEQLKLLAGVYSATKREDVRAAFQRGMDYVFEAQYPNGGWPQNYPLESGYHEAITLNDNAMVHILEVLLTIVQKKPPFTFADEALSQRAKAAFERGMDCLAAMQVKIDGKPTVWCAQHDPLSLAPEHARTKEPPSLSGGESAEVVRFLMRKAPITDATKAMIGTAVAWFENHKLTGLRKTKNTEGKTDYVEDASSKEAYWARFYDLKTGKAIFPGSQDGINYPTFREMAARNKVAYDFMTTKPGDLLSKEMDRWKKRQAKEGR
jgi:PelA/Pel-15E family pectate lyase